MKKHLGQIHIEGINICVLELEFIFEYIAPSKLGNNRNTHKSLDIF